MSIVHVDATVLAALQDFMGEEYPVLLDTYLLDSEERLRMLREAQRDGDMQALRLTAHSFKGSCSNVGALHLAALCKELEEIGRRGQPDEAPTWIAQVEEEFARVKSLFQAERARFAG